MSKTNNATSNDKVLNFDQEKEILRHYEGLYDIVASLPEGEKLPTFNTNDLSSLGEILLAAHGALKKAHKVRQEEAQRLFLTQVSDALGAHVAAHRKAVEEFKAELEKLSPMMREVVLNSGNVPDMEHVRIPLCELQSSFAAGTTVEEIAKQMANFGFKVGKRKGSDMPYVKLPI